MSYIDKQGARYVTTNSDQEVGICCQEENCVHNCDGACDATHNTVGYVDAFCCKETECGEFCCK